MSLLPYEIYVNILSFINYLTDDNLMRVSRMFKSIICRQYYDKFHYLCFDEQNIEFLIKLHIDLYKSVNTI
jgi:hypothetical protein